MGKFKKAKRKLGKFLKDEESSHSRKGLMKLGFGLASGALVFNILLSGTALAHTNTPHSSTPHSNAPYLDQEPVAGTDCWKLVGMHTSTAHSNTAHSNIY